MKQAYTKPQIADIGFKRVMSLKLKAMWRVLWTDNFIVFTFNNKFKTNLTGHVKDNIEMSPIIEDVSLAIKKADYFKGEGK